MRRSALPFLHAAAVALVMLGLAARIGGDRLWTPDLAALLDTPSVPAPEPRAAPPPAAEGLAGLVVSTNLFSARRSAPGTRFGDSTPAPAPEPVRPAPARHVVRLFGIGTTGGRSTALLDADPLVPGAEVYREGDALPRGGRVVRIADDHVVIDTPDGRQQLRLPSTQSSRPPTSTTPEGT